MLRILLIYHTRFQIFTGLLHACNTSARPSLTNSETESSIISTDISPNHIISSPSNSTSSVDYDDNKRSHILQANFVIAVIVLTSFCVLGLLLQYRWKIYNTLKKKDPEGTDQEINVNMASLNGINIPDNCQPPRNRVDMLCEGQDAQEDEPPPYTLCSKPLGLREGTRITAPSGRIDVTNTNQEFTSVEPPAYNEHVTSVQNQNAGDISLARIS
ncbi:hypothetical protein OnM2_036036 [Erysiphe neolycopersici]|uniref:Uncharacterized protein n=1 Tax=Erysiphe neolycopersici TaxID=212602 RepID=A0A420HXK4_9PEZI|nr:hypothetical protein OnM2_036036 [Erysiphe neolycopersici]